MLALCYSPMVFAQNNTEQKVASNLDENAFTFTEAQLGEDDDMSQNVTILNSNSNVYASEAGYLFSRCVSVTVLSTKSTMMSISTVLLSTTWKAVSSVSPISAD